MIKHVWSQKEENAQKAQKHIKMVDTLYGNEVASVRSCVYGPYVNYDHAFAKNPHMTIEVVNTDSVSAVYDFCEGKTVVLNFASYRRAGGCFDKGSIAQEECLCHESILYNVLRSYQSFYDWNKKHVNKSLYLDRAIYSKDILFLKEGMEPIKADVITCACPNKMSAQKYANVTDEENSKALDERIHFVLDIAAKQQVDTLILGAFGCGVFGQDPYEVARIFKKYLENEYKCFKKVIFPVPQGMHDFNNLAFTTVFKEER